MKNVMYVRPAGEETRLSSVKNAAATKNETRYTCCEFDGGWGWGINKNKPKQTGEVKRVKSMRISILQ